jgi:hypothetical protein
LSSSKNEKKEASKSEIPEQKEEQKNEEKPKEAEAKQPSAEKIEVIQTRAEGLLRPELKGKKCFTINGQDLIVDERYEVTKKIGFGAYGMVFAAKDSKTGEEVAIKKI